MAVNISLADIALENVAPATPPSSGHFATTPVRANLQLVDCVFSNSDSQTPYQAFPVGSSPDDMAVNVAAVS
jgi:hypothetical protein